MRREVTGGVDAHGLSNSYPVRTQVMKRAVHTM